MMLTSVGRENEKVTNGERRTFRGPEREELPRQMFGETEKLL